MRHLSEAGTETAGLSADEQAWLRRHAQLAKAVERDLNPSGTGAARQATTEAEAATAGPRGPRAPR